MAKIPRYSLHLPNSARKQLSSIADKEQRKIVDRLDELELNPFPESRVKLKGRKNLWRIRVGTFRVIYQIDGTTIVVVRIAHRSKAYRPSK